MSNLRPKVILLVTIVLCSLNTYAESEIDYKINSGDVLEIMVWKDDELTGEVIVRPDGRITFPLVGSIQASNHTVEHIQSVVEERLASYLPDPVITVAVKSLSGNRVYVIGKVNKPGVFPMTQHTDVMQALSMAGGLTAYASRNNIKILRRNESSQIVFKFNYSDVEDGEHLEQNRLLLSGDVVVVP
jgi:polysaccharide export outer membrane protein